MYLFNDRFLLLNEGKWLLFAVIAAFDSNK